MIMVYAQLPDKPYTKRLIGAALGDLTAADVAYYLRLDMELFIDGRLQTVDGEPQWLLITRENFGVLH